MRALRFLAVLTVTTVASSQAGAQRASDSTSLLRPGARVRLTLSVEDARRTGRDLVKGLVVSADPQRFIVGDG
jgi:hypothetical protein